MLDALVRRRDRRFGALAFADVAPGADDFDRLALLVPHEPLLVVDPEVAAIALPEAVLDRVRAVLEKLDGLRLDRCKVVRVDAAAPEIRVLEIVLRLVAEPLADVLADEGRREVPARPIAVDHRRGGREQVADAILRRDEGFADLLARADVVPRRRRSRSDRRPRRAAPAFRR